MTGKMADPLRTFGEAFSDGIEVIFRVLRFACDVLIVLVGAFGMGLFIVLTSPLTILGLLAKQLGFKSEWHR